MSDYRTTQYSFNGGIISRALYGRDDIARKLTSLKRAENMMITATGGAMNRPGLRFVGEVKDSTNEGRLMTFEAAGDDAFLMEFGHLYMRPVSRGGFVDAGGGAPYEVASPYGSNIVREIYTEQSNDVATIVHPLTDVRELRRLSATNWQFATVSFVTDVQAPTNQAAAATTGYTGYGEDKEAINHFYKISTISGNGEESLPTGPVVAGNVLGYDKNYNTITWDPPASGPGADEYVVYKASNGVYGSIGRTPDETFKDNNISPDFTSTPQDGYNPFVGAGNFPSVVTFAQQRRVFAGTLNNPQTIYMTQSGNYRSFARSSPSRESDGFDFTLAAERKQDIYHILSIKNGLIVFTRSGEWKVTGRDGFVITPEDVLPEPQSRYGSAKTIRPILAGETILFADRTKRIVYEMEYNLDVDGYRASDKTLLARDLFEGRTIKAWAYAAKPYGVIWCVMDDGNCLSFTYLKEHDVWGWCQHDTRGRFYDVAVVPEDGRDVPYFIVERRIGGVWKKYIEMMEDREFTEVESALFMDSALSYDEPRTVSAVTTGAETVITLTAHGWTAGDEVDIRNTSFFDSDDQRAGSIDGRYTVEVVDANNLRLKHATVSDEWEPGDAVDTTDLAGLFYTAGVVRRCISQVTGLDHLEGRRVTVLADGYVIDGVELDDLVVTDGALPAFPRAYARISVGLPYRSLMETLDLVNTARDDNGVLKATGPIYARFDRTRGVKVGQTEETAVELLSRDDEDYYSPPDLKSGSFEIDSWENWDNDIPMMFIQDYPLPMNILGLTMEYVYGG
jgi:hypothetical protein